MDPMSIHRQAAEGGMACLSPASGHEVVGQCPCRDQHPEHLFSQISTRAESSENVHHLLILFFQGLFETPYRYLNICEHMNFNGIVIELVNGVI